MNAELALIDIDGDFVGDMTNLISCKHTNNDVTKKCCRRREFIFAIFEVISGDLAKGGSASFARKRVKCLTRFLEFADGHCGLVTSDNANEAFVTWADYRLEETRSGAVSANTIYGYAATIASMLARVSNQRPTDLLRRCRVRKQRRKPNYTADHHKQNLEKTSRMGKALVRICNELTYSKVFGEIPVVLSFDGDKTIEKWCGFRIGGKQNSPQSTKRLEKRTADKSIVTRSPVINLRIEAEMLIFISQTSMNLEQAKNLTFGKFSYESFDDQFRVRRLYKNRKKGEVEFEIFSDYRVHFSNYIAWLRKVFPNFGSANQLVFPFVPGPGRPQRKTMKFTAVRSTLEALRTPYVSPRTLRRTRVNWLLRRSGDEALTAELAQHSKRTLVAQYEEPNHQRAIGEITRFWNTVDPCNSPPASGGCAGETPTPEPRIPISAPEPDCTSPSGCFFCVNHRDFYTYDYVWSVTSHRHLKTIELSLLKSQNVNPQ